MLAFSIARHGNPNVSPVLEAGEKSATLKALLMVSATGSGGTEAVDLQLALVIDGSTSMGNDASEGERKGFFRGAKQTRMAAAQDAMRVVVSLLPARTMFFMVLFTKGATMILPPTRADEAGKAAALRAINQMKADGNTYMSHAIAEVRRGFAMMPPPSPGRTVARVTQFLSDGENDPADMMNLRHELDLLGNMTKIDCRGIGTDWDGPDGAMAVIRKKTLGTLELIPTPAEMEAKFRADIGAAINIGATNVRLRLTIPPAGQVSIKSVQQRSPGPPIDLTRSAKQVTDAITDFPLGSWQAETRKYRVELSTPPGREGTNKRLGKCSIVMDGPDGLIEVEAPALVISWTTGDESMIIDPEIARDEGQTEMSEAIQRGMKAKKEGRRSEAEAELGNAVRLAKIGGHADMSILLEKQVSVLDADHGSVVLRDDSTKADDMSTILQSQTLED